MHSEKKRILLTGGRFYVALDLARQFHSQGHEVYSAESTHRQVCNYSNAVKKSFVVPSPRFDPQGFISTLCTLIEEHRIDLLIPTFEETFYISQFLDKFPKSCRIFTMPFDVIRPLHNKWEFTKLLEKHGFKTPKTILVKDQAELNSVSFTTPYVVKATYSRASLNIHKVQPAYPPPKIPFEEHNPWIAQEWLEGSSYCAYCVAVDGKINALSIYPVIHTVGPSGGCLTFKSIENQKIKNWIERLVDVLNYTGQISFDFIENRQGELFAIECNPRATSGVHLFEEKDNLASAFFSQNNGLITPHSAAHKQIMMGMLIYGWKYNPLGSFLKTLTRTPDVIYSKKDILPFLSIPYVYGSFWTIGRKLNKTLPAAFTHDIEWNNEQ